MEDNGVESDFSNILMIHTIIESQVPTWPQLSPIHGSSIPRVCECISGNYSVMPVTGYTVGSIFNKYIDKPSLCKYHGITSLS